MITIEEFKKIDLRVAEILDAQKIEGTEKLLKLKINLGDEERIIVAGIGRKYFPEELIGKKIIIVANLEPKEIFGIQSFGMLLAVTENEEPILIVPEKEVSAGVKVK